MKGSENARLEMTALVRYMQTLEKTWSWQYTYCTYRKENIDSKLYHLQLMYTIQLAVGVRYHEAILCNSC